MLIARKTYNSKNLFTVSAHIEMIKNSNAYTDVAYLEFYQGFDQATKISMKVSTTTLRAIAFAMQELILTGATEFKKINNSAQHSQQGGAKTLSFNVSNEGKYFLNLQQGENEKRHFATDKYMFEAIAKDVELISEETQKMLYITQQTNNKEENES
ncbi:MAG: hypothetical protein PHE67_07770 [Campylobacterales bacterium]|nr:hypothetical protein [Campylobacterales bacterium]